MNHLEHFDFSGYVFVEAVITGILLTFLLKLIRRTVVHKTGIKGIKQGYPFF